MKLTSMKKFFTVFIIVLVAITLFACSSQVKPNTEDTSSTEKTEQNEPVVFKIGMTLNDKSNFYIGAVEFSKRVEEKTNGNVKFEIYPSAVLGNDRDLIEGLSMGTVDMAIVGTSTTNSFVPETQVFGLPYLFRDRDHVEKVVTGPVGDKVANCFEDNGIKYMAYWENGFRHLTNSKRAVKTVTDLKGLKIRVMQSPVQIALWGALGSDPTPITWAELFTALQQGTVDGQENPTILIRDSKFDEVQKYMTLTGHVYDPCAVMFSMKSLEEISPEYKQIIFDTAKEVREYQVKYSEESEGKALEELEQKGFIIERNPDIESFKNLALPVIDDFIKENPWAKEYVDEIRNTK